MRLMSSIPALPVRGCAAAAEFYRNRLGFDIAVQDQGFAKLTRDDVQIHLWQADDQAWSTRQDFAAAPVCSGAESFLAGTASCRIEVDDIDGLYQQMQESDVLHDADQGSPSETAYGTREFAVTDMDQNLIEFFTRTTPPPSSRST